LPEPVSEASRCSGGGESERRDWRADFWMGVGVRMDGRLVDRERRRCGWRLYEENGMSVAVLDRHRSHDGSRPKKRAAVPVGRRRLMFEVACSSPTR